MLNCAVAQPVFNSPDVASIHGDWRLAVGRCGRYGRSDGFADLWCISRNVNQRYARCLGVGGGRRRRRSSGGGFSLLLQQEQAPRRSGNNQHQSPDSSTLLGVLSPGLHAEMLSLPASDVGLEEGQSSQELRPEDVVVESIVAENLPTGQEEHVCDPVLPLYFPGGHEEHVPDKLPPQPLRYWPAGQPPHMLQGSDPSVLLNFPLLHAEQVPADAPPQ